MEHYLQSIHKWSVLSSVAIETDNFGLPIFIFF